MEQSIIKIENLSHRYSTQWAIRDINFEITKHGIYGLLGSNGAGKSTTMNIMCGVLKQSEGEVYIKGVSMRDDPVKAKQYIGFLPQKPPLYSDLTVQEYLNYCAILKDIPCNRVNDAIDEVMERCDITHFRNRVIRNLSGGYQQRLGIAQAIIHKPECVILDEPTNGLDPNQIQEIRLLIKEIAKEQTVILSTHILSEVQATCDYIWMVEKGTLVFNGTVDDFNNYIVPHSLIVSLGTPPALTEITELSGIIDAEQLPNSQYRITFSEKDGICERIIQTSIARNWKLTEIYLEKTSLDAVFAVLSKK